MNTSAESLYQELMARIRDIETEKDILVRSEKIVRNILEALSVLKQEIKQIGFADTEEEIAFYKYIKPKFQALYIYHVTVFSVESDRPLGGKKTTHRYFHNELRRIDNFFYHNLELYKYYRSGKTHLDKDYFTRGQGFDGFVIDIVTPIIDREFCTLHSIKIAFLIAYQQLRQYLQDAMMEIATPQKSPVFASPVQLTWTDSKAGLIELAYALHAAGSFNNGKATLKQVTDHLEMAFHVELGNTSRVFQELLARKKGNAAFLDRLKKVLNNRMTENDY